MSRGSSAYPIMNDAVHTFIQCLVIGAVMFAVFGSFLFLIYRRRDVWTKISDKDAAFCRRVGLPTKFIESSRRFEQGRGIHILLWVGLVASLAIISVSLVGYTKAKAQRHRHPIKMPTPAPVIMKSAPPPTRPPQQLTTNRSAAKPAPRPTQQQTNRPARK